MTIGNKSKKLTEEIKSAGLKNGADLVGFAPSEKFEKEAPKGHKPSILMSNAKSIITVACGRQLNEDRDYYYEWRPQYMKTIIKLKDGIGSLRNDARKSVDAVKAVLIKNGYLAVTEMHGWSGILSFKMAAYLSGLGVIGKGDFIVHPTFGPLNVLSCIVTDAPLEYGDPINIDVCGNCIECIKACAYGAFIKKDKKYLWIEDKCRCYDLIMNPVNLKWVYGPCNSKCANACPIGK